MTQGFSNFIGIDVSKDKIDVYFTETQKHIIVNNSKKEIRQAFFQRIQS